MKKISLLSLVGIFLSINAFAQFTRTGDTLAMSGKVATITPGRYSYMNFMFRSVDGSGNFSSDTTHSYFIIEKPFGYTTYDGVRIRDIKTADMKRILHPNPEAYKKYSGASNLSLLGTLMLLGGSVATFMNTTTAASGEAVEPQAYAIGLGLTIGSIPWFIGARGMQKKAIMIYNGD
jgi:hypothetical protein